jgi:putative intracellular protease/amidase
MKVAYVVYPDFTALDLIGPCEVISRWPDAEVHFLASSPDPVRTDCGLTVIPTDMPQTLADQPRMKVVAQMGRAIVGARIGRARRALSGRRRHPSAVS